MRDAVREGVGLAGPAPAMISKGATPKQAASRCLGFRVSSAMAGEYRP